MRCASTVVEHMNTTLRSIPQIVSSVWDAVSNVSVLRESFLRILCEAIVSSQYMVQKTPAFPRHDHGPLSFVVWLFEPLIGNLIAT